MSNLNKMVTYAYVGMGVAFIIGLLVQARFNLIKRKNPN